MRILMISDVYFPRVNGVSTSIQTFRDDLLAMGHRCVLVAPAYPAALAVPDDADIARVASRRVPRDPEDRLLSYRRLMRWAAQIPRGDFDIVHVQTPFAAHYAGVAMARRLAVPVVETYHTYFEHYLQHYLPVVPSGWARAVARRATVSQCGQVAAVVSPSRQMASALEAYGVGARIEVLPTGLPESRFVPGNGARFRAQHGIPADRPVALFVGRAAHEKNIDFLVRMLPALLRKSPHALLVIAGEGPAESHLRQLVAELGLGQSVRFIGYLDRDSGLRDCYRAADVFVFASRTETQGLVLLEAMAQGTPVVSTAVMGTIDVLQGSAGALVPPEDTEAFALSVSRVLDDPGLRTRLQAGALEHARRWASCRMAERLVGFYQTVLGGRAT